MRPCAQSIPFGKKLKEIFIFIFNLQPKERETPALHCHRFPSLWRPRRKWKVTESLGTFLLLLLLPVTWVWRCFVSAKSFFFFFFPLKYRFRVSMLIANQDAAIWSRRKFVNLMALICIFVVTNSSRFQLVGKLTWRFKEVDYLMVQSAKRKYICKWAASLIRPTCSWERVWWIIGRLTGIFI